MTVTVGATTQVSNSVDRTVATGDVHFLSAGGMGLPVLHQFSRCGDAAGQPEAQHIRLQPISQGIPQKTPTTWDFSDHGRHHPAGARRSAITARSIRSPSVRRSCTTRRITSSIPRTDSSRPTRSRLVQYYNTGGFTDAGGTFHKSPSSVSDHLVGHLQRAQHNNVTAGTIRAALQRDRAGDAGRSIRP